MTTSLMLASYGVGRAGFLWRGQAATRW